MHSVFLQIGVVTIVAAVLGIAARFLRQPIILAYIVAGILLGAAGLNVIPDAALTSDVATIGIVFLLFLIGLELDVGKLRRVGTVVAVTSLVQLGSVMALTYFFVRLLGYAEASALYLGAAAAFSSTAVVLKRLTDQGDLASLYGKVAVGILLLQDVAAILLLMVVSANSAGGMSSGVVELFILKSALFFIATWLVTRYVLGAVFFFIAKSTELLFLTSIAYAFFFAMVAESLGFSKEIGAFLAGLSLATLPYNLEIISRVKPLKDFFLVLFFVVLGLEIVPSVILNNLPLIVGISAIVLFGKSFVTAATMTRMGYPKRPSYLTGAALGQMSEFSLLLVLLAAETAAVPKEIVGVTAAAVVITIVINTYWNGLNRYIYPILAKPLKFFSDGVVHRELHYQPHDLENHTLMFGANRLGYGMLKTLEHLKHDILVIDHNPEVIRRLLHRGVPSVYGDIDDYELLRDMGLSKARMVISTVANKTSNIYLIEQTRATNRTALVIVTAEQVEDALELYAAGADYVIVPHLLGGEQAAQLLAEVDSDEVTEQMIRQEREKHVRHLARRRHELVP